MSEMGARPSAPFGKHHTMLAPGARDLFCPGVAFGPKGNWIGPRVAKYGVGVDIWGWGVAVMSMACKASSPLYGRDSELATAMKLVKVFGMRLSDLPAFNAKVKSLDLVLHQAFLLEEAGAWPESYWSGRSLSVLRSALRFNPADRPSAESIVTAWTGGCVMEAKFVAG